MAQRSFPVEQDDIKSTLIRMGGMFLCGLIVMVIVAAGAVLFFGFLDSTPLNTILTETITAKP